MNEGPVDEHDANDEEKDLQYSPAIISWATAIAVVAPIAGALASSRAMIIWVALVHIYIMSIHRLICFLCDR